MNQLNDNLKCKRILIWFGLVIIVKQRVQCTLHLKSKCDRVSLQCVEIGLTTAATAPPPPPPPPTNKKRKKSHSYLYPLFSRMFYERSLIMRQFVLLSMILSIRALAHPLFLSLSLKSAYSLSNSALHIALCKCDTCT